MKERIEIDSLGEIKVPFEKYYGAQTQRSKENFAIGEEKVPIELIRAFGFLKKAAAIVNFEFGLLSEKKKKVICESCDEITDGKWDEHFPLSVWQTGSGTQTNMNVNEVISNRCIEKMGGELGSKIPIHPNDDVNKSQSSNDAFPTAMYIASSLMIQRALLPNLHALCASLGEKAKNFMGLIKIGRTHLMDAAPLSLGQEFSAYASQIKHGIEAIETTLSHLAEIALGGTAVGTGINAPKGFGKRAAEVISELTGCAFVSSPNKFESLSAHDAVVETSGSLKRVACSLMKIANDIRLLASGPRCGIGEIILPANEPGSSIMPGKINPTQCEAATMVAVQIYGNDAAIAFAGSQGHLELNVFKPVMIYNFLQSIRLLADVSKSFNEKCIMGIEPHHKNIKDNLNRSLMLATVLNTEIGYDEACRVVKKAFSEGITLKKAVMDLCLMEEERFDEMINPSKMAGL